VQEPVVIPPSPVVDQPVQVQEEPAVLPPTTVAQEQAQEAVQPPVQPSTGVGLEQVRQIVSEALLVNPSLTEQQVLDIVTGVVDNLPAGLTSQDVAEVVDAAIGRLPQGPTTEDIDSALTRAMADVAKKSEVVDAIRNIQFPAGLSEADVSRVITDYMRQNPGLSPEDVATQVGDLLSRLPTYATPSDVDNLLRSRLSDYATSQDVAQLGGDLQTQVQNLNQDLQFAISDAIASGLRGDAALREGLDSLAGSLGTTRSEVLNQLGTTVQALRSDFASQLGGVQTQVTELGADLSSAIESARAAGLRGDAALQAAVDTLANRLGTTTDQVLSQLGATEQGLRDQFAGQLGEVESSLTGQIGVLSQQTQAALAQQSSQTQQQFNTLSAAQQAQADALVQQGVSLSAALNEVQSGLTGQIGGLRQDVQEQYDMLTAAQQAEVGRRVQQGEDLTRAISDVSSVLSGEIAGVQAGLSGQIGGLRQEVAEQYEMLTDAQQAEVARRVQQGEDLTRAISDVSSVLSGEIAGVQAGLAGQIGGLRQEVAEQYEMLSDAQQAEVARRVQQGEDLTRAISDVSSVLSGEIAGVQAGLTGQIGGLRQEMAEQYETLTAAQQAEVARRVQQGEDLNRAIADVQTGLAGTIGEVEAGLTGQIGGLRQEVQQQYSAMTAAQQAEVAERVRMGQDLTRAISDVQSVVTGEVEGVKTELTGQIGGLRQEVQEQYEMLSDAQQQEVRSRISQGENLEAAINSVATDIGGRLTSVEDRLNSRIQELLDQDYSFQAATNQALQEVTGSIGALGLDVESQIDEFRRQQDAADAAAAESLRLRDQQQQRDTEAAVARAVQQSAEEAAARDAARAAASAEQSRRATLAGLATSFMGQGASSSGVSDPYKATFLKPFIVGGAAPQTFEGPLAGFLKQAMTGDFLPDKPEQSAPDKEDQTMTADQYFGGGQYASNPLDMYQPEQDYAGLYGFRQGGMVPAMAMGGTRYGQNAHGGLSVLEHSGKRRLDYRQGDAVTGIGDGQSDDIPAMLADGEFVIPADVVAALGNGSTKAGSDKLYEMMHNIRRHHRSAGPKDLPPPAKAPLEYIKSRKGRSA
jgi:phage host-nuclease inhibitor protein Gam